MNFNNLTLPLGIKSPSSVTIPWGKGAAPSKDPMTEVTARETINSDLAVFNHLTVDNMAACPGDKWSPDLDPAEGRVLRHTSGDAPQLLGGKYDVALEVAKTDTGKTIRLNSASGNMSHEATFVGDEFSSSRRETINAAGVREVYELKVNSAQGTLSITSEVFPPA